MHTPLTNNIADRDGDRQVRLPPILGQARAMGALAVTLALTCLWRILPRAGRLRRAIAFRLWSILLAGFGIEVRCHGRPDGSPDTLTVSNHVSWTDIAVFARVCAYGFVAKSEVAAWPVIGGLSRRWGCIFIDRTSRSAIPALLAEMESYPEQSGLILFAEGTTSDGAGVLPLRSSLFPAGSGRWKRVQPVVLSYRDRKGMPLTPQARRGIAWLDDDDLMPHALALAASGGAVVDVWFEQPIGIGTRKQASYACQTAIAGRLARIAAEDQAATLKRAA